MRILIFGDSITQGFYDSQGGWATRLANQYHMEALKDLSKDTLEVFNLGISGETAEGLLKRLKPEFQARIWRGDRMIVVISIGINNAVMRENRAQYEIYEFQEVYEKILKEALKLADYVLCVWLSAVDDSLTDSWPYSSHQHQWHNNRIMTFEDTIKQAAQHENIPFVPIHAVFLRELEAGKALLADGLHPNDAGHQFIVELVNPAITELTR